MTSAQDFTSEPPTANGTHAASQSLLTKTRPARKATSVEAQNPEIPTNAIFRGECGKWWTGAERSHASCCHLTFTSLSAFERHRKGMRCNPPEDVGLVAREKPYGLLYGLPGPVGGIGSVWTASDPADEEPAA